MLRPQAALPCAVLALLLTACNSDDEATPQARVISPVAGVAWSGTQPIAWTGFGDQGTITIELSTDGGMTFPTTIVAGTGNDGRFDWDSTTQADAQTCRFRVSGNDRTATSGTFAVDNTAPVVDLTAPNGGELVGADSAITWTTTDANAGTMRIELSSNGGASYDTVIAAAAPDTGSYQWNSSGLADGTTYRVRLTPTDQANNAGAPDSSDMDFEIDRTAPTIALTAPNGGESLSGTTTIQWVTTDTNPGTVDIFASVDGGANYSQTVVTGAPDTGTYAWATGTLPDSTTLRVRVMATDGAGNDSTPADSAGDFSATNLRLTGTAHYRDVNGNAAVDAGDELYLRFDKDISLNTPSAADVALPKAGDALGAGAGFAMGAELNSLLITLGASPTLRVRGTFDATDVSAAAPSGFELADPIAANAIESAVGGIDAAPIGPIDVAPEPVDLTPLAVSTATPRRAALGDLDQDGDLDLVVAVTGGDASERWQGDGLGGWTLQQMFDADDTRDVAIADMDGDGHLDVVTAVNGANKVWLNNGTGTLSDSGQTLGTRMSQGVELFDFDRDGDVDAFFGNSNGQPDTLWRNDGAGTLTDSGATFGTGSTVATALGDFDGDGLVDVYSANSAGLGQVWRNTGTTFVQGSTTIGADAQDVAVGDLDGDGDLDIVVSVLGQNQVNFNDGSGAFSMTPTLLGNNDNRGVAVFDLDGDGDLDILTAKNTDSSVYFLNDGTGAFVPDSVDTEPDLAVSVVAGRLDADSDVDFLLINDLGAYRPYLGSVSGGQSGAAHTSQAITVAAAQSGRAAVGDIDADGDQDVVVPDVVGQTLVLLGDGAGDFTAGTAFGAAGARGGELFDADGDGDLDYLQRSGAPGTVTDALWLNGGSGAFTDSGLTLGVETYAPGDVDGDGDPDLIVVTATEIQTWDGDGLGAFAPSGQTLALAGLTTIVFADLDGDGDLDAAAADASDVRVLENDGAGAFTAPTSITIANVTALVTADLDRDGDRDLLFATSGGENLLWASNTGSLTFAANQTAVADTTGFGQLTLFDYDEDGDLDLFAVDATGEMALRTTGNGDGTFQAAAQVGISSLGSIAVIDADRDGDPDVYASLGDDASPSSVQDVLLVLD